MSFNNQTVCTPEQLALAASSEFYCFTREETIGLVVRVPFEPSTKSQSHEKKKVVNGCRSDVYGRGHIDVRPYHRELPKAQIMRTWTRKPSLRREMSYAVCVGPNRGV
jgi:hypothetical protein